MARKRTSTEDASATWCEACHWTEGAPCPARCGAVLCEECGADHLDNVHGEEA